MAVWSGQQSGTDVELNVRSTIDRAGPRAEKPLAWTLRVTPANPWRRWAEVADVARS